MPNYFLTFQTADDRAWEDVKDAKDAAPLTDFVSRFPDSPHAVVAKARVAQFALAAKHDTENLEALYWQSTVKFDTISAYLDYLAHYPGGAFSTLAQSRIAALLQKKPDEMPQSQGSSGLAPVRRAEARRRERSGKPAPDPGTSAPTQSVAHLRAAESESHGEPDAPSQPAADGAARPARQHERQAAASETNPTDMIPPPVGEIDNYAHARCAPGYVRIQAGGDWATSWQCVPK